MTDVPSGSMAHYLHASLYRFSPVAVKEVTARFNRAANEVAAELRYHVEAHVLRTIKSTLMKLEADSRARSST